jgi:hypothetical protein
LAERGARIIEGKLLGKKVALFIYGSKRVGLSRMQIHRMLYGSIEKRVGTGRYHKRKPYRGFLSEQVVGAGRVHKEYSYRGILFDTPYWRPLPNSPLVIVKQKFARSLESFFDEVGLGYIRFDATVRRIRTLEFWESVSKISVS